jgi:hypothetical protein
MHVFYIATTYTCWLWHGGKGNQNKEKIYRNLLQVEKQRDTACKVRYIRDEMNNGSTSMVQVQDDMGRWRDVTEKISIKEAIMEGTRKNIEPPLIHPLCNPH